LEKGLKRVDDLIAEGKISGKDAFELYDTYGFPFDLTKLIAAENKLSVDEKEFASEMRQQKERSRSATTIDAEDWIIEKEGNNTFVGYDVLSSETALLKYRKIKTKGKELYQLVLEETPFYAESGGQVGDRGQLIFENTTVKIFDTKKDNDLIIHFADSIPENLSGKVMAKVDADKRKNTALHHSATHLLHAALRKVLGTHVAQKGSLVNEEHLRFDFSHFAKMTDEEIQQVEMLVNKKIRENIPVVIKEMPKEEAMQLGAMALFGEKYGDNVRVVIIDPAYSIELCGGTHIGATGELGICKITNETAVAAGVRRIEAVCGTLAESYINNQLKEIALVRQFLKHPKDVTKAIENLAAENNALRQNLTALEEKQLAAIAKNLLTKTTSIGAIQWLA
ncbi:MAG: alanine--tRNA ligase, partial [Chitinophagaceae bacterium]|nr:alanine--tRNA ligase [Chitinophagaceae bacterium]